jgi:hypothetical protein
MDQELREAFATLSSQLAAVGADAREASARANEAAYGVTRLAGKVERLEHVVFGSTPPPSLPAVPIARRVTQGEGDIVDLTGQVLKLAGELAEVKGQNEEQLVILRGLSRAAQHPLVKRIAFAVGTLLLLYVTHATAKLQGMLP